MASWDFFHEFENLRREIDDTFRSFGFSRPIEAGLLPAMIIQRKIPVNFSEDDNNIYIDALVPGVDPKVIELSVFKNTITISGEKLPHAEQKKQLFHRNELSIGPFSRILDLPVDIDPERVNAECRDGLMHIILAKAENAKPRKIEISVS
jgi:HSP20 family protein